jgi:hypothetical protein
MPTVAATAHIESAPPAATPLVTPDRILSPRGVDGVG